jgi:hypothetical protein
MRVTKYKALTKNTGQCDSVQLLVELSKRGKGALKIIKRLLFLLKYG